MISARSEGGAAGAGQPDDAARIAAQVAACRRVLAEHSKSFALAARLLPRAQQDDAAVVYAWCRRADDAIDLAPRAEQPAALARLAAELEAVYADDAPLGDPVLDAFRRVARARPIPQHYPAELLAGMHMDCTVARYADDTELLRYCWRVAGTVGLMMAHVLDVDDVGALRRAAHMGMGMQLTNICRDVGEDWDRGRLYLPATRLARHGAGDLGQHLGGAFPEDARGAVAAVVRELLDEADRFYRSGDAGLIALPLGCAPSIRVARLVYAAIGGALARQGFDPLRGRAYTSGGRKLALALRGLAAEAAGLPRRLGGRRRPTAPGPRSAAPSTSGAPSTSAARPTAEWPVIHFPDDVLPVPA